MQDLSSSVWPLVRWRSVPELVPQSWRNDFITNTLLQMYEGNVYDSLRHLWFHQYLFLKHRWMKNCLPISMYRAQTNLITICQSNILLNLIMEIFKLLHDVCVCFADDKHSVPLDCVPSILWISISESIIWKQQQQWKKNGL